VADPAQRQGVMVEEATWEGGGGAWHAGEEEARL
jgi:hypothetical protein